jgi:predicted RNA-binding protein with PIN domain
MSPGGIRVLLVDGHNVIYAWDDLALLHRQSPAKARHELCRRLGDYQDMGGCKVVAVFDGRGPAAGTDEGPLPIQVFYASAQGSADVIIAQLANRYAATYLIEAASDDLAVQHAVAASGGTWLSTASLRSAMDGATTEFRRRWNL